MCVIIYVLMLRHEGLIVEREKLNTYDLNKASALELFRGNSFMVEVLDKNFDESLCELDFTNDHNIGSKAVIVAREKHSDIKSMEEIAGYVVGKVEDINYKQAVGGYLIEDIPHSLCEEIVKKISSKLFDRTFDEVMDCLKIMLKKLRGRSGETLLRTNWTVRTVGF